MHSFHQKRGRLARAPSLRPTRSWWTWARPLRTRLRPGRCGGAGSGDAGDGDDGGGGPHFGRPRPHQEAPS